MERGMQPVTWAGLVVSLVGFMVVSVLVSLPSMEAALSPNGVALVGFVGAWVLAGAVVLIVTQGEERPLESIGLTGITWKEGLMAVGIGILLSLTVPLLSLAVAEVIPATEEGSIGAVAGSASAGIILLSVLTAGITEEVLYRAYPIERLTDITGQVWVAVLIALVGFTLPHLASWNTAHVVGVVIPLGLVLSGLYLWKRNLVFNMIVHVMINLPLVFIALGS